jgi:hypothetical protein
MIESVCMKHQIVGVERLLSLEVSPDDKGRPVKFPSVPKGHKIVCGIDFGDGERIFICGSLRAMQKLHAEYIVGKGISISWYHTDAFNDGKAS